MKRLKYTDEEYEQLSNALHGREPIATVELENDNGKFFDDFSNSIQDIDFSELKGGFKKSFSKVNKKLIKVKVPNERNVIVEGMVDPIDFSEVGKKEGFKKSFSKVKNKITKKKKPLTKDVGVKHKATIYGGKKKISKIIVPDNRKTIVEGVSKFILSQKPVDDALRNINYYKGEKLEELVFTMDNTQSDVDFNLELFNPSMPLDYLQSTSQNLNDKISIANGVIAYSDVLFNLLANPSLLVNAKFVFDGVQITQQMNVSLTVKNKNINGEQKINPLTVPLFVDNMQFQNNIVTFNLMEQLNRPFIPDGMDVMGYNVLAGMKVTFAFFYKQHSLKKILFKEAKNSRDLI